MRDTGLSWDEYWQRSASGGGLYAAIAKVYRRSLISRAVRHYFHRYFTDEPGRVYLHAGCGSGESDSRIGFERATFVLMDISYEALRIARKKTTLPNVRLVCGDIFHPPFRDAAIDGTWNLGVMEHFHEPDIQRIFAALARVLKPGARALIFWPPKYGFSVIGLNAFLFVVNRFRSRPMRLYPDEVSRFWTRSWAARLLAPTGLSVPKTHFGIRDFFTYVVMVARKPAEASGKQWRAGPSQASGGS